MSIDWSREYPFERSSLKNVPEEPGIYQIFQSEEYQRYKGITRVLKIGASESNLRSEIENHFIRHTAANRLARIRNQQSIKVTFICALTDSGEAIELEKHLLKEFEDYHWDLPLLNSTRGYARGKDRHYKNN